MDFSEIFENLKNFFAGTKKRTLVICGILVFMTLSALIVLALGSGKSGSKPSFKVQRPLNAEKELLIPKGPDVPDEYITSRKTESKWSEAEAEKWFTVPDEKEVLKLSEANSKMIDEIIGAAP